MSCFEKCNEFARSKPARVFYGILLVLACCVGIIRLLELSNQMKDQKFSHIEILIKPDKGLLYHFKGTNDDSREWSEKFDSLLTRYKYMDRNCDILGGDGKCSFNLKTFGPCSPENNYGINGTSPCIFLKMRKSSWSPSFFNASSLPVEMPSDLRSYIVSKAEQNITKVAWISCQGETPADIENIGAIIYFPERGFILDTSHSESLEPLVAVLFESPIKGILISVECKLWTRSSSDSASFHIIID